MTTSVRDRQTVMRAIEDTAERLITLVSRAPDPTTRVASTPQWTVAEAFAHVVTVAPRYCQGARQEGQWVDRADDLPELNARQLTQVSSRDLATLSAQLRTTLGELADLLDGFDEVQPTYRFHGGAPVAADVALGILLGELVVHGWDIAQALAQPWPIQPSEVELIMQGLTPMLPGWLDPEQARNHTGTYEVRLRGQGTHRFSFRDGALTMNPPGTWRPDVIVSADPVTFLLVCAYKRRSQWPAILTGRLLARGRKPWLALTFARRIHKP